MKLLVETLDFTEFETLIEGSSNVRNMYITGPFIQTEIVNKNRRMYRKKTILEAVNTYIRDKIDTNRALGELNHPAHPEVNPERAAIKIVSLKEDGNNFIGRAKVLRSVPMGAIVAGLIDEGVQLGVSTRALGSLKSEKDYKLVCDDFRLMTAADIVSDPSAPDAFITALMENREWVWENGNLVQHEIGIKKYINNESKKKLTEADLLKVFQEILKLV